MAGFSVFADAAFFAGAFGFAGLLATRAGAISSLVNARFHRKGRVVENVGRVLGPGVAIVDA